MSGTTVMTKAYQASKTSCKVDILPSMCCGNVMWEMGQKRSRGWLCTANMTSQKGQNLVTEKSTYVETGKWHFLNCTAYL